MCDYSLMSVPNRLAKEGEDLVTHRFASGTIGLVSYADLHPRTDPMPPPRRGLWSALKAAFTPRECRSVMAVCIPPGARLLVQDIPAHLQHEIGVGTSEQVVFTQITAAPNSYRDSVRFCNGHEVLLQRLSEEQRVRVLTLGSDEVAEAPELPAEMVYVRR
jgi:hypothetical protein